MANKINKPLCATQFGNTGFGDCFLEPGKFAGAIQVPAGFEIAEGDVAGLQAFLQTKLSAAIGTRIFPYHNFISLVDNTEDVNITTTDYGAKYINRDGFYDVSFRYLKGGVQLHQEIQKNAGSGKYFLFYDDNGVLYGYKSGGKLKGIPVDIFYVNPWRLPTGADQASYLLRFIINPKYMNKGNLGFIPTSELDFNLFDLAGLQNLNIQLVQIASNVVTVKVLTDISNVDMYDTYADALAATAAWTATNNFNNPVGITAVAKNTTAKGWNITFLSGNWLASDTVDLNLVAPAVLGATPLLVAGFEGVALTIEAPAS